jgi:hypothetical protein
MMRGMDAAQFNAYRRRAVENIEAMMGNAEKAILYGVPQAPEPPPAKWKLAPCCGEWFGASLQCRHDDGSVSVDIQIGEECVPDVRFCPHCGKRLEAVPA